MRRLTDYISEAASEWEQKHDLINKLVKAGVGETSHLWLATMDELEQMAREAGVLDEAGISGIQPITPTTSMTDKAIQPQGQAQTPQGAKPVSPAANVQIGGGNVQPGSGDTKPATPQDMQKQIQTLMQNPEVKRDFEELLKKMVTQAGIK
jgi:hypothetical protein